MADFYRTTYDQRPAPPPPSGATDLLDRTARQVYVVRTNDRELAVHKLARADTNRNCGRVYRTRCDLVLSAEGGAVLTTRDVTCVGCQGTKASKS